MKKSLKLKVAVTFITVMVLTLGVISGVHLLFSAKVYKNEKINVLEKSRDMMNSDDPSFNAEQFESFCSVNGLTYVVADVNLSNIYSNAKDGAEMSSRLFGNVSKQEEDNTKILKTADQYSIIEIRDRVQNIVYLELWGNLDNNDYYLVYTPLDSINTAARIATRFYLYVGFAATVFSAVIVWMITRKLIRPIQELTELSQEMAALDFDARYTSGGEDEIGLLGKNFNIMSSHLKQAIIELQEANQQLQKDIDEKIQIDDMRKEFLANVSHELKTPIALIQGYAEGLKENVNEDPEDREFYCDVIIDEANKMNRMVKQLMTLNQLEFGSDACSMGYFDLNGLIKGVIMNSGILLEEKEANFTYEQADDGPLMVCGDEFKIEEVVTNYLSNAMNHLDGERNIRVRHYFDDSVVITEVFNNGSPIPENELDNIWVKFYKVDKARTREYGGSGIGLSIVKAIMDAHGQRCWAENRSDGVSFFFTMQRAVSHHYK